MRTQPIPRRDLLRPASFMILLVAGLFSAIVAAGWISYNNNVLDYEIQSENPDWMASIPDHISLKQFSIPGTHNSGPGR